MPAPMRPDAKPNRGGVQRTNLWPEDVKGQILELVATKMGTLNMLLESRPGLPSMMTVYKWEKEDPEFAASMNDAREARAHMYAEEALAILDDSSRDIIETPRGPIINNAVIQRDKSRAEHRRWLASKYLAKVYGDKVDITGGTTVNVTQVFAMPDNGRGGDGALNVTPAPPLLPRREDG